MGTMLILVWVFASLHATFYGLIRKRYADRLGLSQRDFALADHDRTEARAKARKALHGVRQLRRR
jgi:hypothetical protein